MIHMKPTDEDRIGNIAAHVLKKAPTLPYHNAVHALDVWNMARQYALMEDVLQDERLILEPAALLHDVIFDVGRADNEERTAEYAEDYLRKQGYAPADAQKVGQLILVTKRVHDPQEKLEAIMMDADVDNLGRKDFFEKTHQFRKECGVEDRWQWYKGTLDFMNAHQFYTPTAIMWRQERKGYNVEKLKKLIRYDEAA